MIKNTDRIIVGIAGVLVAAALLYLGLPRTVAAFKAFDSDPAAAEINRGERPDTDRLRRLVVNRTSLLGWNADPRLARQLAGAYHQLASTKDIANRPAILLAARDASIAELALRPLNATAWWRLGHIENVRGGFPSRKTADYLVRSLRVQPNAFDLTIKRLNDILGHWGYLDPGHRRDVGVQIAAIWQLRRFRERFQELASPPFYRGVIRATLLDKPEILEDFDREMARFEKRKSENRN